jgi:hypothetical protein
MNFAVLQDRVVRVGQVYGLAIIVRDIETMDRDVAFAVRERV